MGGLSKSKTKQTNQADFGQDVWGGNVDIMNQMYGNLGNLFGQTAGNIFGYTPQYQAQNLGLMGMYNPYVQQQMAGGAYGNMGLQDALMESLAESQSSPTAMQEINNMIMGGAGNTYADAMRDQYISDATQAQENMLANMDARAAAAGMSGGSRHGTAIAEGMEDINRNLQRNMATTGYETFDKDLDRKLAIAQQADQNRFGREALMADMIGGQQGAMNTAYGYMPMANQLLQSQFMPYSLMNPLAGIYAGAIPDPTVLSSGSSLGTGKSKGSALSLLQPQTPTG